MVCGAGSEPRLSLTSEQVVLLVNALCDPKSAYILGAGASAPDVPVMGELIGRVLGKFKDHVTGFVPGGTWQGATRRNSQLLQRVVTQPGAGLMKINSEFIK